MNDSHSAGIDAPDLAEATGYRDTVTGRLVDAGREVIHDRTCGVPTGRTFACACNERNGYRVTTPGATS